MGKKEALAYFFYKTRLFWLASVFRSRMLDDFIILAYHRVLDNFDENTFEFDPELVSATSDQFELQMAFVKKHFNAVTFTMLIDAIERRKSIPKNAVVITFDDGFDDNYRVAFPILKRLGLTATIFLSTGYINTRRIFWFDWIAYMLGAAPAGIIDIPELGQVYTLPEARKARRMVVSAILRHLKNVSESTRLNAIRTLEIALNKSPPDDGFADSRPLSWSQVQEMASYGIEFGSHSVTHAILSQVENDQLEGEMTESKSSIEKYTGNTVDVIAYPVGGEKAFNSRVIDAAKSAGYKLGCSYVSGINRLQDMDRYALKRLHVERYMATPYFISNVCAPEIFGTERIRVRA